MVSVLVTNDDGISSDGIRGLIEVILTAGHAVTVAAPLSEQSGRSMAVSIETPVSVKKKIIPGTAACFGLSGTSVDCVKAALTFLNIPPPEIVISGLNIGINAGRDVRYSATVGAAMEAALSGIPAIAVSAEYVKNHEANLSQAFTLLSGQINNYISLALSLGKGCIVNVNYPYAECKGMRATVLSKKSFYSDNYTPVKNGFLLTGIRNDSENDTGTDLGAVLSGYGSVSVIHTDMQSLPADKFTHAITGQTD